MTVLSWEGFLGELFQLTREEFGNLKSQIATSSWEGDDTALMPLPSRE